MSEWMMDDEALYLWVRYRCRKFDEAKAMGLPCPRAMVPQPQPLFEPVSDILASPAPPAPSPPRKRTKPSRFQIYRHGKLSFEEWRYPEGYTGPRPPVEVDQKPCFREEVVIPSQPEVLGAFDNDIDDAILVDHIDWDARLQEGSRRRAERQQQPELESEHDSPTATDDVPSCIGTIIDTAKS